MIRPVVGGGGPTCLKQTPAPGGWKPVHSQAWVDCLLTSMHRMHRIFSGDGWLVFPDILKSAHDHRPSQRLLQQPPVLIILCILCIDVQFIVLLDGSAQSRGAGARLAGKREFPKGDRPAFREVARRIPPTSPSGRHPRERGRPARTVSLDARGMGPAEAEAGRRCRLIPEMAGWLVFPDILKSAHDHRPSQRLLQQPPVLIILCIDVPFIVLLDGSAQSR